MMMDTHAATWRPLDAALQATLEPCAMYTAPR
jgi:hypothetical protein